MAFFSDVFLVVRLELWGFGRKITEVKGHFHHITSRLHSISMTYPCWCLGFIRVFHCNVLEWWHFSTLAYCTLWKKVAICSPHVRSGESYFTFLSRLSPHKLFSTYLFVLSFDVGSWIFIYTLSYNLILCFLFCCCLHFEEYFCQI